LNALDKVLLIAADKLGNIPPITANKSTAMAGVPCILTPIVGFNGTAPNDLVPI
jgi:hypothetical protein